MPTSGGPPAWGLGVRLTTPRRKNNIRRLGPGQFINVGFDETNYLLISMFCIRQILEI
jgi:hypothetical protein